MSAASRFFKFKHPGKGLSCWSDNAFDWPQRSFGHATAARIHSLWDHDHPFYATTRFCYR